MFNKSITNIKYIFKSFIILFYLLIINSIFITNSYAKDNLWEKTVEIAEKSKTLIPYEMIMKTKEFDNKKTVTLDFEMYIKPKKFREIDTQRDVIKVLKNGKNITQEYKDNMRTRKSRLNVLKDINALFLREFQSKVSYQNTNLKEIINGRKCFIYDFRFKKSDKEDFKGRAWIDELKSIPTKIDFSLESLTFPVKQVNVVFKYGSKKDEMFFVDKIEAKAKINFVYTEKDYVLNLSLNEYSK